MRAEKEPTTGSRERGVVEIQLRDTQREQDSATANSKHKEEKKEIFTKVGQHTTAYVSLSVLTLRCPVRDEGRIQHHRQRTGSARRTCVPHATQTTRSKDRYDDAFNKVCKNK